MLLRIMLVKIILVRKEREMRVMKKTKCDMMTPKEIFDLLESSGCFKEKDISDLYTPKIIARHFKEYCKSIAKVEIVRDGKSTRYIPRNMLNAFVEYMFSENRKVSLPEIALILSKTGSGYSEKMIRDFFHKKYLAQRITDRKEYLIDNNTYGMPVTEMEMFINTLFVYHSRFKNEIENYLPQFETNPDKLPSIHEIGDKDVEFLMSITSSKEFLMLYAQNIEDVINNVGERDLLLLVQKTLKQQIWIDILKETKKLLYNFTKAIYQVNLKEYIKMPDYSKNQFLIDNDFKADYMKEMSNVLEDVIKTLRNYNEKFEAAD